MHLAALIPAFQGDYPCHAVLAQFMLPLRHLADLLGVHDVITLFAALREDPAHLLHSAEQEGERADDGAHQLHTDIVLCLWTVQRLWMTARIGSAFHADRLGVWLHCADQGVEVAL